MKKIGNLLRDSVGRDDMLREARAQAVLRQWSSVVGKIAAEKVVPDSFSKGVVWVHSESSAWSQELTLQKEVLLERLNKLAGEDELFVDIRVAKAKKRKFDAED